MPHTSHDTPLIRRRHAGHRKVGEKIRRIPCGAEENGRTKRTTNSLRRDGFKFASANLKKARELILPGPSPSSPSARCSGPAALTPAGPLHVRGHASGLGCRAAVCRRGAFRRDAGACAGTRRRASRGLRLADWSRSLGADHDTARRGVRPASSPPPRARARPRDAPQCRVAAAVGVSEGSARSRRGPRSTGCRTPRSRLPGHRPDRAHGRIGRSTAPTEPLVTSLRDRHRNRDPTVTETVVDTVMGPSPSQIPGRSRLPRRQSGQRLQRLSSRRRSRPTPRRSPRASTTKAATPCGLPGPTRSTGVSRDIDLAWTEGGDLARCRDPGVPLDVSVG